MTTNELPTNEKELKAETHEVADPIVTRLAELDETPWYQKRNLRLLYLLMFPTCIGVEMTKLSHPKERAIIGSLFNASYFIGSIVAAGVTLGTFKMPNNWGWRIPSLLQLVPSMLQISFIYLMPESPRWLISKDRGDEAMAILVKYHAEGDANSEFVKAEYVQIEKTLELEKETENVGWMELLATPGMRRRVLVGSFLGLATQWSGNGLTSYVLECFLN
ncbi:hypothetical protein H0H87_012809 [Tephrocybe sp. NHM501043]|nr:hypothetical protein H0H87_012809 [Tephrocybe sp. NHM501043]